MGFKTNDNFDENAYVKVNERLAEFREKYPEGFISTFKSADSSGITFEAVICRNIEEARLFTETGVAAATGHAFLANDEFDEKVQEYTETVAYGRALACLGFKVEKAVASAEEMNKFNKRQEKKANKKDTPTETKKESKVVKFAKKTNKKEEKQEEKKEEKKTESSNKGTTVDRLKITNKFAKGTSFKKS